MIKIKPLEPQHLELFLNKKYPNAPIFQTPIWQKVMQESRIESFLVGFFDNDLLIGSALIAKHHAKRATYMEIASGPILDYENLAQLQSCFEALKAFAKAKGCSFVRLRPNLEDAPSYRKAMQKLGLKIAPMYMHAQNTAKIDLSPSCDDLLKNMRRQTRYEIKRGIKQGITITKTTDNKAFDAFYRCQKATAARQGFIISPRRHISALQKALGEKFQLYIAKNAAGEVLAYAAFIVAKPEAFYLEAASTDLNRKQPGAYAIQWQAIQDFRQQGIKSYDLFGIAPEYVKNHRFAGVTTFKMGFGSRRVNYVPDYDLVVKRLPYLFNFIIETIRKHHRHL